MLEKFSLKATPLEGKDFCSPLKNAQPGFDCGSLLRMAIFNSCDPPGATIHWWSLSISTKFHLCLFVRSRGTSQLFFYKPLWFLNILFIYRRVSSIDSMTERGRKLALGVEGTTRWTDKNGQTKKERENAINYGTI